jgi:hypothetical protein
MQGSSGAQSAWANDAARVGQRRPGEIPAGRSAQDRLQELKSNGEDNRAAPLPLDREERRSAAADVKDRWNKE